MKKIIFSEIIMIFLFYCKLICSEPPTKIELTIPDYEVTKIGEFDYVEIPEGYILLLEEGRPRVPYYIKSIDYPKGYRIQEVILKKRSGLKTEKGLNLPVVIHTPFTEIPLVKMKTGLYPEKDYEWKIKKKNDGSTKLIIFLYPFYYEPETKEAKFYNYYEIEIKYVKTGVSIKDLSTDKPLYDHGENVKMKVKIENEGKPENITIKCKIKRKFTNEVVAEPGVREFKKLAKSDSVIFEWKIGKFSCGYYYAEIEIRDPKGNLIDKEIKDFSLGTYECKIIEFNVNPEHFKIGEQIKISLNFKNSGSCKISGSAIIRINMEGKNIEEFVHDFSELAPDNSLNFTDIWDTREAKKGKIYYIIGYVLYEGTSTLPEEKMVSTNLLPIAKFVYSPEKPVVGKEVIFDASLSYDRDGNIREYKWDFGDGGNASGKKVKHIYYLPGDYEVVLTVVDNENGETKIKEILNIKE